MVGVAIHGGTCSYDISKFSIDLKQKYRENLRTLVEMGCSLLEDGVSATECVEQVICRLEDSGLYNAGRGSILSETGEVSMDAGLMSGEDLAFGGVYGVNDVKNPISVARQILAGPQGCYYSAKYLEMNPYPFGTVGPEYFKIDKIWTDLYDGHREIPNKDGTVGCVAIDKKGNLAAGTSTGGLTKGNRGRISDACIIGAGTYANNSSCAISCSGHGETIVRNVVANRIHGFIIDLKLDLPDAIDRLFSTSRFRYNVGVIAIDKNGSVKVNYNSQFMLCAYRSSHQHFTSTI